MPENFQSTPKNNKYQEVPTSEPDLNKKPKRSALKGMYLVSSYIYIPFSEDKIAIGFKLINNFKGAKEKERQKKLEMEKNKENGDTIRDIDEEDENDNDDNEDSFPR